MSELETVEIATSAAPDRAVIWLHGLGADGNDFVPIVPELNSPDTRFVFPHAPVRPVTLNNGMPMRAPHGEMADGDMLKAQAAKLIAALG